jgi:spore coat protein U-like protein
MVCRPLLRLGTLFLVLAGAFPAAQAAVSATTAPSAAVVNACTIQSTDNLTFGAYNPTSGLASTASGQVQLRCTKAAAYSIAPTTGGSALTGPGGTLNYGLYVDTAFSQKWGGAGTVGFSLSNQVTSRAQFSTALTGAQFAANPALKNGLYYYANGTYYTGYLGQSSQALPGAVVQINLVTSTYTVPIIAHTNDVTALPKSTGNGPFDSYLYMVLPADTHAYSGSNGNYTVQVPNGTVLLKGTASSSRSITQATYYAQLPAGQDRAPGVYTDTVIIGVTF